MPLSLPLSLKKNFYGIPEPDSEDVNSVYDDKVEIIITPGVAFDKKGGRIGMGKGFYDKYFESNPKPVKIGLAFEEQVFDSVPSDEKDKPVDFIITDKNIYICDKSAV